MRVLWIVNKIFPYPAKKVGVMKSVFGGWLEGLEEELRKEKDIELAIATIYRGKEIKRYEEDQVIYYIIPGAPALEYDRRLEVYWGKVVDDFKPDIVHIHGTEYAHGLAFLNKFPRIKNIVSIQGLISSCSKVYYGNIDVNDIIKNQTLRDFLKHDNIIQQKKKFQKRGESEVEILKKAHAVIGRTTWDFANVKAINPNIKYYKGNEILRKEFYKERWNIEMIEKDTIFCSQAGYPIKGFHYLIESINILKRRKPNIKLYVAGPNILDNKSIVQRIKRTGYAKYLSRLINKYKLENKIIFTGLLNESDMITRLKKSNVFVLPSVIENSSNSLGEAMLLGMPCVASNVGGNMDMLENKKEGFLYPYTEPAMCAEYIEKFLNNKQLCLECGNNARNTALIRHNPEKNVKNIITIYKDIISRK